METNLTQANQQDPRWDEVRASLPIVQRWLVLVAQLVREHDCEVRPGTTDPSIDATSLAETSEANASNTLDDLSAKAARIPPHSGVPVDSMPVDADERLRLRSLFEQYEACQEDISPPQWPAVCLRFRDGLTEAQIGGVLKKSRSSIHGLLKRARQAKEAYQQRRRLERYRVARKNQNP